MTRETEPLQPDKIFDHHRQQLSAMMDGALAPDQARFLLRRLQHDSDLTACWERWQLCGDVLRGNADALLSRDFAQQVATAIAAEAARATTATRADRPRWARWNGGAALAASVAVAALLVLRQMPNADGESSLDSARVIAAAPAASQMPAPTDASIPSMPPAAQQTAATLAAAVAVAEVPRQTTPRRSRGQSQRAALRSGARAAETALVAASTAVPIITVDADPFVVSDATLAGRPWPRAILPNAPANGGFTVGLGSGSAPSFYPFEPRMPTDANGSARDTDDVHTSPDADDPPAR